MSPKASDLKSKEISKAQPALSQNAGAILGKEKKRSFHIVGMGGSAGSLEAFEEFFKNMPEDSGLAFILVSHLDPNHKGILPELIQRTTRMKVNQAKDGMKVQPNHIYVIPPNRDMAILHGALQLLEPSMPRGLRMPIDFFFRHLAEDQKEKSIGIIFSGMGTDGSLGLKAIKEKLGMAMVQDVSSSRYDGMPSSAISTGRADYIAPASELPTKLMEYVSQVSGVMKKITPEGKRITGGLPKIFALIRAQTGNDFSLYKKSTIHRRIERRMSIHQIDNINHYVRFLQENPHEVDLLFKELLIGVTSFFRDRDAFEALKKKAIVKLLENKQRGDTIRIWVVGCSTGEEAYSIAMILKECIDDTKQKGIFKIQIYATDIDRDAIDVARQGVYPANIEADVSPERLKRFFAKENDNYRIKNEIRDMIIFAVQNVLVDPPFTKLDLLSCRNLLIYLNAELQKKLLPLFHYTLNQGGYLFLGSSETIGIYTDLFVSRDNKWKLLERRDMPLVYREVVELPISHQPYDVKVKSAAEGQEYSEANIANVAQNLIFQTIVPPVVIINNKGDILYLTRRTGKYLEPPVGKANINIYAMAREGLRAELGIAIRKVMTDGTKVTMRGLQVKTNGSVQNINLIVSPFNEMGVVRGLMMVQFEDVEETADEAKPTKSKVSKSRLEAINSELEKELQYTKEHLRSVVEEMATSQEELKSSNEELQSTNEELQSINEELITSKEEMQSLNEELTTLNSELESKNEELSEVNSDMKNILNSMQVPTIFLDNNLKIKRFTPFATKIASLIQSDIGRPITDIMLNILYEDVAKDVNEVLQTLVSKEDQVSTKDGKWYSMRIIPYRTLQNIIDGVVITFSDITDLKKMSELMKARTKYAEGIVNTVRDPMLVLSGNLNIVSANPSFYRTFQVSPEEIKGKLFYGVGNGQWDIPALRKLLEKVLPQNTHVEDFLVEHDFPGIGHKRMLLNARKITDDDPQKQLILLSMEELK